MNPYLVVPMVMYTAVAMVTVLTYVFLLRIILGFLPSTANAPFTYGLSQVTESLVFPVRAFCKKMGWFRSLPIDIPFLITVVILIITGFILSVSAR